MPISQSLPLKQESDTPHKESHTNHERCSYHWCFKAGCYRTRQLFSTTSCMQGKKRSMRSMPAREPDLRDSALAQLCTHTIYKDVDEVSFDLMSNVPAQPCIWACTLRASGIFKSHRQSTIDRSEMASSFGHQPEVVSKHCARTQPWLCKWLCKA